MGLKENELIIVSKP